MVTGTRSERSIVTSRKFLEMKTKGDNSQNYSHAFISAAASQNILPVGGAISRKLEHTIRKCFGSWKLKLFELHGAMMVVD